MAFSTKSDYVNLMDRFLSPLLPFYSKGGARLSLGDTGVTYDKKAIELEGFSRPLWALVPFWAGGGNNANFEDIYKRGLASGANPKGSEYWQGFSDYDQRFVEMCAIAFGLLLAPEKLWQPLSSGEKQNLADWLSGINHHFIPKCNWQFFRVFVNLALKDLGMPYSEEKLTESLEEVETYYLNGGWYKDGDSDQKDYYIPFAMHYYSLIYSKIMGGKDPRRCEIYKKRSNAFAKDFIYWFADNGSALPFGRSLTYRFAQSAFWSACIFAGIQPFSLGIMKGIISRNFEYWLSQKIFDRDGVLNIGYCYPNLIMAERYNSPTSPYWAMKTFLVLALEDSHAFWQAKIELLPKLASIKALPRADMLMQRQDGDVIAYTPGVCQLYGHGHLIEKYSKFAYSTAFGFSVMGSSLVENEACPDSMLAVIIDDHVFVRKNSTVWQVTDSHVYSEWTPFTGIYIKTTITPTENGHKRHHVIESDWDFTAVDYGFSVPKFTSGYFDNIADDFAEVGTDKYYCKVSGIGNDAIHTVLKSDPNTNILFPNTLIPAVKYSLSKGKNIINTLVVTTVLL